MSKLKYGAKFDSWDNAKQMAYLEKLAASQNEALDAMQKERNSLLEKVKELSTLLVYAQDALSLQKEINRHAILKQNSDNQHAGERIQELQAKLRAH